MTEWPSLGIELDEWTQLHRKNKASEFDRAEELFKSVRQFLTELEVAPGDPRQVLASSLLARCLESHSAIIILMVRGMSTPTRVLLRALLEATFTVGAIAREPEFVVEYLRQDHVARLRTLNRLRNSASRNLLHIQEAVPENLHAELAEMAADEKRISIERIAQKAGLHDWYVMLYPLLSPAVHSSVRDIESYIVLDPSGKEIRGFRVEPTDADTEHLLKLSGSFLLTALAAAAHVFQSDAQDTPSRCSGAYDNAFRPLEGEGCG